MKKFEFNSFTSYFCIDPKYLSEGLKAAKGKYSSICVQPMDSRTRDTAFDMRELSKATWIERLILHQDVTTAKEDFKGLEGLTKLEALALKELAPIDYAKFKVLKELGVIGGKDLIGTEKVSTLEILQLGLWNSEELPENIGRITARKVKISVAKKLTSIEPLWDARKLTDLTLQRLPALTVDTEINRLPLVSLWVEKCDAWTDFRNLRVDSLRKLLVSKVESLRFIKQLKHLEDLNFWECVDGDLTPVLEHPTLTKVSFVPERKHYSHKLAELRRELATRRAGKA
jgi:hypothetical protein